MLRTFWHKTLPILVVRAYRLQPARMRGAIWRQLGFGKPTSHLAVPRILAATTSGWLVLWATFLESSWD